MRRDIKDTRFRGINRVASRPTQMCGPMGGFFVCRGKGFRFRKAQAFPSLTLSGASLCIIAGSRVRIRTAPHAATFRSIRDEGPEWGVFCFEIRRTEGARIAYIDRSRPSVAQRLLPQPQAVCKYRGTKENAVPVRMEIFCVKMSQNRK